MWLLCDVFFFFLFHADPRNSEVEELLNQWLHGEVRRGQRGLPLIGPDTAVFLNAVAQWLRVASTRHYDGSQGRAAARLSVDAVGSVSPVRKLSMAFATFTDEDTQGREVTKCKNCVTM